MTASQLKCVLKVMMTARQLKHVMKVTVTVSQLFWSDCSEMIKEKTAINRYWWYWLPVYDTAFHPNWSHSLRYTSRQTDIKLTAICSRSFESTLNAVYFRLNSANTLSIHFGIVPLPIFVLSKQCFKQRAELRSRVILNLGQMLRVTENQVLRTILRM